MSKAKVIQKAAEKLVGKTTKKATAKSKAAKRKAPSAATQKGVKFAKNKDIQLGMPNKAEEQISRELATARVAKGSRAEKITVGRKSDPAKFDPTELLSMSAKKRISKMVEIEKKIREGTATAAEKKFLTEARKMDAEALRRRNVNISKSTRGKKKAEPDNFMIALRAAKETGELVPEFETLTKNQQDQIVQSAKRTLEVENPDISNRRMLLRKLAEMDMNMGGMATARPRHTDPATQARWEQRLRNRPTMRRNMR